MHLSPKTGEQIIRTAVNIYYPEKMIVAVMHTTIKMTHISAMPMLFAICIVS